MSVLYRGRADTSIWFCWGACLRIPGDCEKPVCPWLRRRAERHLSRQTELLHIHFSLQATVPNKSPLTDLCIRHKRLNAHIKLPYISLTLNLASVCCYGNSRQCSVEQTYLFFVSTSVLSKVYYDEKYILFFIWAYWLSTGCVLLKWLSIISRLTNTLGVWKILQKTKF